MGAGVRRMDGPVGVFAADGHRPGELRQQHRQSEHDAGVAGEPIRCRSISRRRDTARRSSTRTTADFTGATTPARRWDSTIFSTSASFADAPREGRYVSDVAVAARIEEELRRAAEPTFLFCVTMENQGRGTTQTPPPIAPFTTQPRLSPASHLVLCAVPAPSAQRRSNDSAA